MFVNNRFHTANCVCELVCLNRHDYLMTLHHCSTVFHLKMPDIRRIQLLRNEFLPLIVRSVSLLPFQEILLSQDKRRKRRVFISVLEYGGWQYQ